MVRALVAAALLLTTPGPARPAGPVDLALVLAVDSSSSVDYGEFNLQMRGLADAFRDESVQNAIELAAPNGMAVTLVLWSGNGEQRQAFAWTTAYGPAGAEHVAELIDRTPRLISGGGTAINDAIDFSIRLLLSSGVVASRRVIDVSGDGRDNMGAFGVPATLRAVATGITVNGLAILNEDPLLDFYYQVNVIGGASAFMVVADDYEDFAEAIRVKLISEIIGAPMS